MRSSWGFYAILILFAQFIFVGFAEFDLTLAERYSNCICEACFAETKGSSKTQVVLAQVGQNTPFTTSASADLSSSQLPPFARLRSSSRHCESHAVAKCALEMPAVQATEEAQRFPLPDLPFALANSYGSYLHPWVKQQHRDAQTYQQQWQYHGGQQYYQEDQSPRSQKSPRRYQSPKKKSPRGGKGGKGQANPGFGPSQYQPYQQLPVQGFPAAVPPLPPPSGPPPPWIHPGAPPNMMPMMNMMPMQHGPPQQACSSLPPTAPLTLSMPTVPTMVQEQVPNELLNFLQKRSVDLPLDVQQRVQSESKKKGKRVIKDLQEAAKSLGAARTAYEEALVARTQHISSWKSFLAEAVKNWTDYAKQFEQHEQALQLRITSAREQFQAAKECLDTSKTSAVQMTEISDEEDLPGEQDTSAMQITESIQMLSNSLMKLSKEAESIQVEGPAPKRPRRG